MGKSSFLCLIEMEAQRDICMPCINGFCEYVLLCFPRDNNSSVCNIFSKFFDFIYLFLNMDAIIPDVPEGKIPYVSF